jgi:hypothetical protein
MYDGNGYVPGENIVQIGGRGSGKVYAMEQAERRALVIEAAAGTAHLIQTLTALGVPVDYERVIKVMVDDLAPKVKTVNQRKGSD